MSGYCLGLLTAVVFFLCLLLFFWLGTRYVQKKPPDKVEDETIRKQKKLHEDLTKLMSYDVDKALQRKQVTQIVQQQQKDKRLAAL